MRRTLFATPSRLLYALRSRGAVLRLLYALYYLSMVSWSSFFPVYLLQVGLSGVQIGLLSGIGPAAMLLSQPLWGLLADLRGRRRTLLLTMGLAALLLPGYAWPAGFWFLFAWSILYALLSSPISPLIDSLVLDHLEERRGSFGPVRLWGAVGWAAGAVLVGRAIAGRDIRLIFAFASLFMLLGLLLAWRGTGEAKAGAISLGKGWRGVGVLLRHGKLLAYLALLVFVQLGTACIWSFYPVYMTELGAPRQMLGLAITLRGLGELPMYLAAAWIIRRFTSARVLVFAFLVFACRAFLYSTLRVPALAIVVELSHGLSFSLFLVASVDYVHRLVPREWRATGQALFTAAWSGAGSILGNAWAGWLYDRVGVQAMFRVNGVLILAGALAALAMLRQRPTSAD